MGADLTIESVYEANEKIYRPILDAAIKQRDAYPRGSKEAKAIQKEVTRLYDKASEKGYFRDSYNGTNVMWTLGLSWWEDITPLQDKDGNISGDKLKTFFDLVNNAKQKD